MKILHFGHVPLPKWHPYAGRARQHPGKWVVNWAAAQRRAGMDVEICCLIHKAPKDFECEVDGVPVHFLRSLHPYRHYTFYAVDQLRMARFARKFAPDLVVGHGTEDANGWAALRSGLPFCIVAQGLVARIVRRSPSPPTFDEFMIRAGERHVWRRTRFAIAVSDYVARELAEDYPKLDISRIPLTYAPELAGPVDFGRKAADAVAFVGTPTPNKGIGEIAEAFGILASRGVFPFLHIAGNGPENAPNREGETLRRLRSVLGSRLVLHGKLPTEEVFGVLDGCGTIVAPSREEMFGNQLVEGLMRGCRAVVTDDTALAENARRFGNSIVVPQADVPALAEAIETSVSAGIDQEKSAEARRNIREYMSPETVAAKSGKVFSEILEKCNRKSR